MLLLATSLLVSCVSTVDVLDKVVDRLTTHTVAAMVDKLTAPGRAPEATPPPDDEEDTGDDEAPPEPPPHRSFRFWHHSDHDRVSSGFSTGSPGLPGSPGSPGSDDEALVTEKGKEVPTADLLHRIASAAGWSMTLVGSPRETVDVDFRDVKPRDALREVLRKSGSMAVLKRDRLVVVASPDRASAGLLVEETDRRRPVAVIPPVPSVPPIPSVPGPAAPYVRGGRTRNDVVRFFADATVQSGQVVQGDVVCIRCDIEVESGAVVRGDAVAVGGSITVDQGALVLGQAVAVVGEVDVARGAQVMGEHVQIGMGRLFGGSRHGTRSAILGLGPFGLFPTIALFALVYLLSLLALRMWPERVRMVGHQMFENPVRSFFVGFLCWLLLLPLVVLLGISIVGIPLIPLLPVAVFLSIVLGVASFALRIGESLPAGPGQRFVPPAALGMGMMTLLLLGLVPWLGVSVLAMIQFFALGSAVSSRFGRALPPHVA